MRTVLSLVVLTALTGCVGSTPVVLKSDDSFVTVSRPDHTSKSATKEVAAAYCRQHGKRAELLSDTCPQAACAERSITYWCR